MKKIVSILLALVMVMALSCAAFADFSYDAASGTISGSYSADGWVEIYVNGEPASGDTLSFAATAGETYKIDVYVDGVLVSSQSVTAKAAEPTEAPATPEPTAEPTPEPTAEPTAVPTAEPTAKPTAAPTSAPTAAPKTDSNGKDSVPKTGEIDMTAVIIAVLAIALISGGVVVATKKHGKQN